MHKEAVSCKNEKCGSGRSVYAKGFCKTCYQRDNTRRWREQNPEQYQKEAEKSRQYANDYYHRNLLKAREQSKLRARRRRSADKRLQIFANAKTRARERNLPFNITIDDVVIPEVCPVLGIPICYGAFGTGPIDGSPTLDRVLPDKGYVRGNIAVISNRANRIKNDATTEELACVIRYINSFVARERSSDLSGQECEVASSERSPSD